MSKIAFLFPGQGAQSVGMGRELAETLPAAKDIYDQSAEILGYDLAKICFEGPAADLDSTIYSQPALCVTSLAALEKLRTDSPEIVDAAAACAGLSLGEYTAMVFAGVMDFQSGLKVVQQRGEAMQAAADAVPSGMVSILGMERGEVEQAVELARGDDILQVANLLCPGNIAVSGENAACERVAEVAVSAGAMKAIPLAVAGAFHTSVMQPAVEKLTAALADVPLSAPKIPVISNVDAQPHSDPEEIRQLLIQQVVSPVYWEDSVRCLMEQGHDKFYEVGPGRVLRSLMKRIDRKTPCHGVMG